MALLLIFIAAFILRLIALNQSLWLDEATTAKVAHLPVSQIIFHFSPTDFHPPLYYIFMKFWVMIFGSGEVALRFPSIIFSLLAGYVVYLIGKELKYKTVGIWASALFLFNPLIMYYSQEARMYMMATCFLASALYFYLRLGTSQTKIREIVLCNVFIALSFFTFYGSVFYIAAVYALMLIKKKWPIFMSLLPGFLVPVIILSPLLIRQYMNAREAMSIVLNWSQVLGKSTLKNLFLIPLKFSIGRISFDPKPVYYIVSIPWTVFIWYSGLKDWRKYKTFLFLTLFPLFLGIVFSIFSPLLQYFRFIYLIVPLSLLLGLSLKGKYLKAAALTGFMLFSLVYLFIPRFHREDWRSLTLQLPRTVYAIPASTDPILYYRPDVLIKPLFNVDKTNSREITVVPYTSDIYGFNYRTVLEKRHYRLVKVISDRGLTAETYAK